MLLLWWHKAQALLQHVQGIRERQKSVGVGLDGSAFDVATQISRELIESAQTFRDQKGKHCGRVFPGVAGVDQLAHSPGFQAVLSTA
jgi:hypothetical protein